MKCRPLFIALAASLLPLLAATAADGVPALSVALDDRGISRLAYDRDVLFDEKSNPAQTFTVGAFAVISGGKTDVQSLQQVKHTTTWDAAGRTLTYTLPWGSVAVKYTVADLSVSMAITVTNSTATQTIGGVNLFPLALHFPAAPKDFHGFPAVTFGTGTPGVVVADYGTGAVAVVNEDIDRPLYCGLMTNNTTATDHIYQLWVASWPLTGQPDGWELIHRPIAPRSSDTYHISLRFGPAGSNMATLAPDVVKAYVTAHPFSVNWPDRRPIGILFPAGSATRGRSKTNPRGWFNDPKVNVTTPGGLVSFRNRLLNYAFGSVAILKKMNAQGMVTWDIEGEEYPQTTTYIGDPRLATTLAPELKFDNVANQYFAMFRHAGFAVGLTLRPHQLVMDKGPVHQETLSDPAIQVQTLVAKITYAEQHWGCKLFYIDSTSYWDDPGIYEQVHRQCPGVLLMPEISNLGMYCATAPFGQVSVGSLSTPPAVRQVYPGAFSVIDASVGNVAAAEPALLQSVRSGDILMFSAWFDAPDNRIVRRVYQQAAKLPASRP